MTEKQVDDEIDTLKCSICNELYAVDPSSIGDQSLCPDCRYKEPNLWVNAKDTGE